MRTNKMKHPDPKLHREISFVKSALRILAGISLCTGALFVAGGLLICAELLGIAEELV